jgi:hypothetical protein
VTEFDIVTALRAIYIEERLTEEAGSKAYASILKDELPGEFSSFRTLW